MLFRCESETLTTSVLFPALSLFKVAGSAEADPAFPLFKVAGSAEADPAFSLFKVAGSAEADKERNTHNNSLINGLA